jgi:hypothetical protein
MNSFRQPARIRLRTGGDAISLRKTANPNWPITPPSIELMRVIPLAATMRGFLIATLPSQFSSYRSAI